MKNKRIVIALGHTSLGKTLPDQKKAVKIAALAIADLVEEKYQIVITHSNGTQVGMIHEAMTEFSRLDSEYTVAPMSVCSAMSQGYIGYDLQNAVRTELLNRGIYKPISTVITQVRVDPFDEAFAHPSKEIGRYMSEEEANEELKKGNFVIKKENGYRRIIASPKPMDIYEIDTIKALLDANQIVIAGGGGGIPVLQQGTRLKGASAVIEKDLTSQKIAELIDAETLLFLTGVDKVALNYGTEQTQELDSITLDQTREYIRAGHFTTGSMLPKVEAAAGFAASAPERKAIITSLNNAKSGINGKSGTVFL